MQTYANRQDQQRAQTYAERQRRAHHHHPLLELPLTAREAVTARVSLGRPVAEAGWASIGLAMKRYEPTISMFAEGRVGADEVWAMAIGGETLYHLTASHVLAIIDAGAWDSSGDPFWIDGVRTELGAIYDQRMPALNVRNWQAGLDVKSHRRYSQLHG